MSERNKKGECCDCGSITEHERSPGCTPPLSDALERRLSALEAKVERIEERVLSGRERFSNGVRSIVDDAGRRATSRPTPPGVFPPMGYAGLVCAGCHRSGLTLSLSGSGRLTCSDCANATAYTPTSTESVHPAVGVATVDGKAKCPQCPESIESRATYARVPEHVALTPSDCAIDRMHCCGSAAPLHNVGCPVAKVLADMDAGVHQIYPAEAAIFERGGYVAMPQRHPGQRDWFCGWCSAMFPTESSRDSHTATLCREFQKYKADVCQTDAARPTGPIAGLDAMLPPIADLVTPANKALVEKWGGPTPAAMLGEAVELTNRAEAMAYAAFHATLTTTNPDGITSTRALLTEATKVLKRAQREAEARMVNCPRGIHGGPGSDACDCAAIAEAETREER